MKNLNQTSFPNRAVKKISVATHLFRGIILFTRKSLRWGTSDSMKLSTRDNVIVPKQTSDMGKKTVSVLAHSF